MAELLLVSNPRKRKKTRKNSRHRTRRNARRRTHHVRRNPHRRRYHARRNPHRRKRRNPSFRSLGGNVVGRALPVIKESYMGAFGALGNDALYGLVNPYLASFLGSTVGMGTFVQYGVKMITALGVGWLARFAKLPGRDLAVGAGTVATHDFLKAQLITTAPTIFGPGGIVALSGYSGLGAYLSGSAPIVGTATFPATNMPFQQPVQMGAYLSGSSGMAEGSGMYDADAMGCDPWGNY